MAKQAQTLFLEEWLRSNIDTKGNVTSKNPSSSSAKSIIQSWSDLRDCLQNQSFHQNHLQSLKTLINSKASLYVADPQAKLLLSILSIPTLSLPHESYPLILRLLYIWIRKSSRPSSTLTDSSFEVLSQLFSSQLDSLKNPLFLSEGILLLGAIAFARSVTVKSKTGCLELQHTVLEENYPVIFSLKELIPDVLAGIGYSLSSSENPNFVRIINFLFGIWERENGPSGSITHGLMILHLTEWVMYNFIASHSFEKIDAFSREILEKPNTKYASFPIIMAAAGVLRAHSRSVSTGLMQLRESAEECIEFVAKDLISRKDCFISLDRDSRTSLLLQCMPLALVRSGSVSSRGPLFISLASSLLTEIFPLNRYYTCILKYGGINMGFLVQNEVKEHLGSLIFKEAGAITGIFCNQYISADDEGKNLVENHIWEFCQNVYLMHRQVILMIGDGQNELIGDLEKIAESAFLMVVFFSLAVTKQKVDSPRLSRENQMEISVKILVSFSCLEYFRRMRLSEYMDTIKKVVVSVQENELACVSFVESMPSYSDLTNQHGSSKLIKREFHWSKDDVQTARILFYMRVIPTCVECLPTYVFKKVVAPTMFLYAGHPNGKVARASHSMFVAFVSSGKDSDDEERALLKEQLVFYYIQRSLEGYPGITPFEGMGSGVAAIVRYLPAGSPSIFYSVHSLVEKANRLCSEFVASEADQWKNWQGDLEPCKKLLDLLLRLLSLVDIQVLPTLMKQLAQLIVQLPKDGQETVLNDLYTHVAESDDVTRKPMLISWLQSLSYLCTQAKNSLSSLNRRRYLIRHTNFDCAWECGTICFYSCTLHQD